MRVITKAEFEILKELFIKELLDGKLIVHPTDTIYGFGCLATHDEAIKKLRKIKKLNQPFSVIVPSKKWIYENCVVTKTAEEWIKKLPGPYTLILKLKNKNCVSPQVNLGKDTLGVRIPNHWISDFVSRLNTPLVSTAAVNTSGELILNYEELDRIHHEEIHYFIEDDSMLMRPSYVIDLTKDEPRFIRK